MNTTKTRKNLILRIAGVALLFTLISTCLMPGTSARYITNLTVAGKARAAKWGVKAEVDSTDNTLFRTEYQKKDVGYTGSLSVKASSETLGENLNVAAPGTSGSITFSITGRPEVAVDVSINTDNSALLGRWEKAPDNGGGAYEPVLWTFKKGAVSILSNGKFIELLNKLEALSGKHAPDTDLSSIYGTYTISWEWLYFSDNATDINDTYIADLAALGGGEAPVINLDFTISMTQIS